MKKDKRPLVMIGATKRLRAIAVERTVKSADGTVLFEGYPTPADVEREMLRVYRAGVRAGRRKVQR